LGGGSSDAATTLKQLTQLWDLELGEDELLALAADLGSDVPFFVTGGRAFVEGRGEVVRALPDTPRTSYVLAKPFEGLETRRVFQALPESALSSGEDTRRLAFEPQDPNSGPFGVNGLQETAFLLSPGARTCWEKLHHASGGPVILSGSGPTSVAWIRGQAEAEEVVRSMRTKGFWAQAVVSVGREESGG
jgi:4-diphosphocytidyl-2-C-methyl-D-erythritol kinase